MALLSALRRCSRVRVLGESLRPQASLVEGVQTEEGGDAVTASQLPIVSFSHSGILPSVIVDSLRKKKMACRHGTFLSSRFLAALNVANLDREGAVRISLAHYNTTEEVAELIHALETLDGW